MNAILRPIFAATAITVLGSWNAHAQANSWTKPTSGYWEEPFWSAGHLPTIDDSAILFTNAGWKALAIGAGTTANHPDSLRIRNLLVDAPVDSRNLLLLNWAGLAVPLQADGLIVGTNGSLLSHFSAMDVGTLTLNGPAAFTDFAQSRFGQVQVGQSAPARLDLTNGWFSAERLILARGGPSIFHQFGGSNQVSAPGASGRVSIDSEGSYNLSGGDFKATFIDLWPARLGTAPRLNVTGGRAEVEHFLNIGGFIFTNSATAEGDWHPGVMELSGGHFKGGAISILEGQVIQTGGRNELTQLFLVPGADARADYSLSSGRLDSARVYLGSSDPNGAQRGFFTQSGGVHSNSESIIAYGKMTAPEIMYFSGTYELFGGLLSSPGIGLDGGIFSQAGGTNQTVELSLTNGGSYLLASGTLVTSNTVVQNYLTAAVRPRFTQGGGEHRVKRLLLDSGGIYFLAGGVLSADMISLRAGTELRLRGIVSSNNTFEINGGTAFFEGNNSLGWLLFNGFSRFDFRGGSSIVHFSKVGYRSGALDGVLNIYNWKGSAQSPGRDQLYIHDTDPHTDNRVQYITFVDPDGYPPGNYRAYRKATGEIVPVSRTPISYSKNGNQLELQWPAGWTLQTATNIAGPFTDVNASTSYTTSTSSDGQRYFRLWQ